MILAEQLSKKFDDFLAVDEVNFRVKPGEIMVLLGPNGAGKTTTIRMLTSILRPTSGRASILGYDVVKDAGHVRRLVGVLTEHHGLYGRMSALDYLDFFGQLYGMDRQVRQTRARELLDQFGLGQVGKKRLGEFSKGMRQKLALVRALLHNPPVVLLDEPTSAMDPESARTVREAIRQLRSSERAIILCTHNLLEAELLADKIAIIRDGRIILQGTPDDLKNELISQHEYELHLASPSNWDLICFPNGVKLTQKGADWLRFHVEDPEQDNPSLLKCLLGQNLPVVSCQEVPRTLEQVYMKAIARVTEEDSHAKLLE